MKSRFSIIPYLVAILVVVGMFRASGAMALIGRAIPEAMTTLGLSPDVVGLALVSTPFGRRFTGNAR